MEMENLSEKVQSGIIKMIKKNGRNESTEKTEVFNQESENIKDRTERIEEIRKN